MSPSRPIPLSLAVDPDPTGERRAEILSHLRRFNRGRASDPQYEPLTLVASDAAGALAGGLVGEFGWRWLHVDLLWVRAQERGHGVGSDLLHLAESEARQRACIGIYLDSFDFQAPEFYKKLGYRVFGVLDDYPPGSRQTYFQKRLVVDPAGDPPRDPGSGPAHSPNSE